MWHNRSKGDLKHGKVVYCCWLAVFGPAAIRIMARMGHDFIMIDGERAQSGG